MKNSLRIGIYGHGVPFSGESLDTGSLGGSETMYIMMSEALVRQGHSVTVVTQGGEQCVVNGVNYLDYYKSRDYAIGCLEYDVFIVGRDYAKLAQNVRTKLLGLWNHDVLTDPAAFLESIYSTDFVFCLSEYHTNMFLRKAKECEPILYRTRNGIDVNRLSKSYIPDKLPNSFIYGSRPERGMIYLLQTIWPRILEQIPDAHLFLAGYSVAEERLPDNVKVVHEVCRKLLAQSKNVTDLGPLKKADWYKALWGTEVMLYPTDFPEISCLNGIEAQACGLDVVTTDDFALSESVLDKRGKIKGRPYEEEYVDHFVGRAVVASLGFSEKRNQDRRDAIQESIQRHYNIDRVSEEWVQLFYNLFQNRATKNPRKVIQQLVYYSDLLAAKHLITETDLAPNCEDHLQQINDLLEVQHSDPEKYADSVDTPDTSVELLPSRMKTALRMLSQYIETRKKDNVEVEKPPQPVRRISPINAHLINPPETESNPFLTSSVNTPLRILDIGCGGGRFMNGVLSRFKDKVMMYGLDFSEKLLDSTSDFLERQGFTYDHFGLYHADMENFDPGQTFDAIFCGEWLEHQQDLYGMLNKLFSLLVPNGIVIFTVPSGPWESLSYGSAHAEDGRELRFHVSHFELNDLLELFGKKQHQIVFDPLAVSPDDGTLLGNWVVSVINDEGGLGKIDYERKFYTTRPYQSISAAIICKNEEDSILGMLKTIHRHVDEIIVYDTGSTDGTLSMIESYSAFRKLKVIRGKWEEDFALARNQSVENTHAEADWILWIDCDEKLVNGHKLRKYVNTNLYNGYVILQHHFSIDSTFTPDVPVRLYRNNKGYRFFGCIHEQVHEEINKLIEPTLVLPDVHVVHFGVITEGQRRAKITDRNLPLLMKDRKVNPDRWAGAIFLMRDLMHMISWTQESRQSTQLDEEMIRKLWEVIRLYEPFKHPSHLFHQLGWLYYQNALQALSQNGIQTADRKRPFAANVKLDFNPETKVAKLWFQDFDELHTWVEYRLDKMKELALQSQ